MSLPDFAPRLDSDLVKPFWQALDRGGLVLPGCSECGKWQWYPRAFITCHPRAHLEWKSVPTIGRVFTYTIVHRSFLPNAAAGAEPYVSALVELDGVVGPRIATFLVNLDSQAPEIGMRVRLHPVQRTGYVAPAFAPIDQKVAA